MSGVSLLQVESELEAGTNIVRVTKDHRVSTARLVRAAIENTDSLELYDRVLQTLDNLRGRGTMIGVVSNLPGWLVRPLLKSTGIGKYVAATATPRWGVPAKPNPHGIRQVLVEMDREVNPRTWFVGDGVVDAKAATTAAVQFAWASYGYEQEAPPGTAKVLGCFDDVLQL